VVVVYKVVEVMMVLSFRLNKAVAELEDANIRAVIVEAERVKCADTDANAPANAPEDANVLLALAAQENVSAVLKDAIIVDANVRCSHSCIIVVS
jgi:hypothetical protein